jgi:predicted N-formylglutamate amidohydrolase
MQGFVRSTAAAPVATLNRQASGSVVLICEHASNYIPQGYERLGLSAADLQSHIAWDIGALALAEQLSALLDAPLVFATHSRLLLDLNRDVAAPDSIVTESAGVPIPGNQQLSQTERRWRCDWLYAPFHAAVELLIDERLSRGQATAVISIHSFTPSYPGEPRPWHVGVLGRRDRRLADRILASVRRDPALVVGDNQPYAPEQGVYHSIERHAERRGLPGAMIEVRNDLIGTSLGQTQWAGRLAHDFKCALEEFTDVSAWGQRHVVTAEVANQ